MRVANKIRNLLRERYGMLIGVPHIKETKDGLECEIPIVDNIQDALYWQIQFLIEKEVGFSEKNIFIDLCEDK